MINKIVYKKELVGYKISKIQKGTVPITDPKEYIQMVTLNHPKGTVLKAHMHKARKRITYQLQECIVIKKGKVLITLYGINKKQVKNLYLTSGQAFILFKGGIKIKMLADSEIFELKNGPFIEDKILI
mgnify:CR=1 FL=1